LHKRVKVKHKITTGGHYTCITLPMNLNY